MKPLTIAAGLLGFLSTATASSNASTPRVSKVNLPSTFQPPQVFKNGNLVHIISVEKNYVKEAINVLIENISQSPQDEYFLPFSADQMERLGGLEVKDRKDPTAGPFITEAVDFDAQRSVL
jgi:oligosaccharyltransferase complex subunit alpha (ribophorin I)